jgi:hypothetical protein
VRVAEKNISAIIFLVTISNALKKQAGQNRKAEGLKGEFRAKFRE